MDMSHGLAATPVEPTLGRRLTPMLRQYVEAKAACPPHAILMFRMGDFFELFFEDAKIAARELDLTLTAREKGEDPIPMAGVPHHAVSGYITRLVDRGYTVALCDQVEDPKKAKGLVKREITRLITPGTVADLDALEPGVANYLACVGFAAHAAEPREVGMALFDLLAGELLCTAVPLECLGDELRRMGVREVLLEKADSGYDTLRAAVTDGHMAVHTLLDPPIEADAIRRDMQRRFGTEMIAGLTTTDQWLQELHQRLLCRVLGYAEATQRRMLPHVMPPRAYHVTDYLVVDEATRRNLELCTTQMDNRSRGSLLWHLDRCRTAMGSRALRHAMLFPWRHRKAIVARLDAVDALRSQRARREQVQSTLESVRDLERLVGRVAMDRASPKDLAALLQSLRQVPAVREALADTAGHVGVRWRHVDDVGDLRDHLATALVDDPPLSRDEGGIFRRGFCADLDEIISLSSEGHGFLADLEKRERQRTGIASLKVRYNRVFGYYLEVTNANLGQVPDDFVRKQTLVGAERFITAELKEFEEKVLDADERRKAREHALFTALVARVAQDTERLRSLGRLLAETDVLCALAQVADEGRYCRPELCDEPVLELTEARHPVLERLMPGGERFVPNDVHLDAHSRQLLIVTGPNMAGKSTVMRQTALCTILAHMGSFVPAAAARVGLCDRLFTRVGASDNLGRGQSTFMVEMLETATILRHASARSLVLLDEIGRGTSTFDGVSLAWAVAEFVHDEVRCRAMFATHYHELTALAASHARIVNVQVAVQEEDDRVVFLRRLLDGAANRSYGIEVARLAGVPMRVLKRAREILARLESGDHAPQGADATTPANAAAQTDPLGESMPAVSTSRPESSLAASDKRPCAHSPSQSRGAKAAAKQLALFAEADPLRHALSQLDPMRMSPMDALAALVRLKAL